MNDELLSIGQVARRFEKSVETVRSWERSCLITALRDPRTHNRFFKVADVDRLEEEIVPREDATM